MVAHREDLDIKKYPENIFRSHQRLLIDTVCSEYGFLIDFFGENQAGRIYNQVFAKTLEFFREMIISENVEQSYDGVGILLMIRILEHYKRTMLEHRKLNILTPHFDQLLQQLWPRLQMILETNINSLKEASNSNVIVGGGSSSSTAPAEGGAPAAVTAGGAGEEGENRQTGTHPHYVTRRYAELA